MVDYWAEPIAYDDVRAMKAQIDALAKRCDDLQTTCQYLQSRIDALTESRDATAEPKDCVAIYSNGSRTIFLTMREAREKLRDSGGGCLLRVVPLEAK